MPFAAAPNGHQLSGRHSQLFMLVRNALIAAHLPTTMHTSVPELTSF